MSLPSKFFMLQKGALNQVLNEIENSGLIILKSGPEIQITNSENEEGIRIGLEFENSVDYFCVVAVRPSPAVLMLFDDVCKTIESKGGIEVKGIDIPNK